MLPLPLSSFHLQLCEQHNKKEGIMEEGAGLAGSTNCACAQGGVVYKNKNKMAAASSVLTFKNNNNNNNYAYFDYCGGTNTLSN